MNLFDSSFLCLDIGTYGVRGIAHRIRSAHIDRSAFFSIDSYDTVFAIKSVVDELEKQIGCKILHAIEETAIYLKSENIASLISSQFMEKQPLEWVFRFYQYLCIAI